MSGVVTIDLLGPNSEKTLGRPSPTTVIDTERHQGDVSTDKNLNLKGEAVTRGSISELAVRIAVRQNLSSEDSWDLFIADLFKNADSVLAIFRERSDNTLKFYMIAKDESDSDLELVFDVERRVYKLFPEDEIDFEVLLGEDMESALPSAAVNIWRRAP